MSIHDEKVFLVGNPHNYSFNKKLCFQARDGLFDCVDQQENGNKFRCPDQLYAYEMWCPPDFRRMHSQMRRKNKRDEELYDVDLLAKLNYEKQAIRTGHFNLV